MVLWESCELSCLLLINLVMEITYVYMQSVSIFLILFYFLEGQRELQYHSTHAIAVASCA